MILGIFAYCHGGSEGRSRMASGISEVGMVGISVVLWSKQKKIQKKIHILGKLNNDLPKNHLELMG